MPDPAANGPAARGALVVTGASRGIGAETARRAAAVGWAPCIAYRESDTAAQAVRAEIEAAGGRAMAVRCDVASEPDVLALFDACDATLGAPRGLVNNAGILDRQMRLEEMSADRMRRIFEVNILGAFLCAREAVRRMSTARGGAGGAIVNVSSRAAVLGSANEYIDYAASKGALDTLTVGLAREVAAEGIRVNAVRPGLIHTDIHASGGDPDRVERRAPGIPMHRGGEAGEVAEAVLWLLGDDASFCSGTFIDVAGGM